MKNYIFAFCLSACGTGLLAQKSITLDANHTIVGDNPSTSDPSAVLDVQANDAGILIPRLTTIQIGNINNPAEGLLVFDKIKDEFYYYNGSDWKSISGVFEVDNGVVRLKDYDGGDDLIFGASELPSGGANVTDKLFFFDQSLGAFRSGELLLSNSWDEDSIGVASFASGRNTMAKGNYSFAGGFGSEALGSNSFSVGQNNISSGLGAFTVGLGNQATGSYTTAFGNGNLAYGKYGAAFGRKNQANGASSLVVGQYNDTIVGVQTSAIATTPLFIVGNGLSASNLSNAFTVKFNGDVQINDAYTLPKVDGSSGQVLSTFGNGNLTWTDNEDGDNNALNEVITSSSLNGNNLTINEGVNSHTIDLSGLGGSSLWVENNGDISYSAGKVGVGTSSPATELDIAGGLKIGDISTTSPDAGMIRYNGSDFQGYKDNSWVSLTSTGSWGVDPFIWKSPNGTFPSTANDVYLGIRVDLVGDLAVVASSFAEAGGEDSGGVNIYNLINGEWTYETTYTNAAYADGDQFGTLLGTNGQWILATAYFENNQAGAVEVIEKVNGVWTKTDFLEPAGLSAFDNFGYKIVVDGDYAAIAAPGDDTQGSNSGAVYIFKEENGNWTQQAKLVSPDIGDSQSIGSWMGLSGEYLAVGAPEDDDIADNHGAVYIYKRTGTSWAFDQKIFTSGASTDTKAGRDIAYKDDILFVNKYTNNEISVFERTGNSWIETQQIVNPILPATNDNFGLIMDFDGTTFVVSTVDENVLETSVGAIYIYENVDGVYELVDGFSPPEGGEDHNFGNSLAVDGNNILVGAPYNPSNDGKVYFLKK